MSLERPEIINPKFFFSFKFKNLFKLLINNEKYLLFSLKAKSKIIINLNPKTTLYL